MAAQLKEKFDTKFLVMKGQDIREQFGVNQWLERNRVITSLDLAKRSEILPGLRQVHWDLVIVDEAHRMSAADESHKSLRYRLGELLRDSSDHILLLTATPHKGDPVNFSLFLQLLDADAYADVKSIREAMDRRRRVLVTGVSAGLGVETARAARGAQVVGAARDLAKAERATAEVRAQAANGGGLELVELDLASLESVRACADALLADGRPFDAVIANAGVMRTPFGRTADGFETQFGTNHLGHFVLVNRIASLIVPGGRLVSDRPLPGRARSRPRQMAVGRRKP
jgi:short chain dehydrogenase/SNF2-related domain